ncbi:MAG: hypothetical protein JXB62_20175 [Pirellulales bacterium]|nr:hypothetical protein [Pirellulales bacterium]
MRLSHTRARRGVLLLVILGLLAMFGLVAVAFVVLTGQAMRSAQVIRRVEQQSYPPDHDLDRAAMQVLRGANSPTSVVGAHGLLEDLYGLAPAINLIGKVNLDDDGDGNIDESDGSESMGWIGVDDDGDGMVDEGDGSELVGIVGEPLYDDDNDGNTDDPDGSEASRIAQDLVGVCGGQLVQFTLHLPDAHRKAGCVLTMLTGDFAGQSTRIVAVNPVSGLAQMLPFSGSGTLQIGDLFTINGVPFSGTGFGYNPPVPAMPLAAREPDEDLNGNGALDPGEDLNGNGSLDVGEVDANQNGILDAGEDLNANGQWDFYGPWYALSPNPKTAMPNLMLGYTDLGGPGGANEDYDAPDYQNMMLAMVLANGQVPIPSLHRSSLVQYWVNAISSSPALNPAVRTSFEDRFRTELSDGLKRKITLRPLPEDHFVDVNGDGRLTLGEDLNGNGLLDGGEDVNANGLLDPPEPYFTGGNPAYQAGADPYTTGFNPLWDGIPLDRQGDGRAEWDWDVDNDGDGRADSIWVDLGFPVCTSADGRQYKPLFAILCVDLDGRLNLNAHGCWAQTNADYRPDRGPTPPMDPNNYYGNVSATQFYQDQGITPPAAPNPGEQALFTGGQQWASLPRGQGYGPADINLFSLLPPFPGSNNAFEYGQYELLLGGNGVYPGRYGELAGPHQAGISGAAAGSLNADDPHSQNRFYEYYNNCWASLCPGFPAVYDYWGFLPYNPIAPVPNAFGAPMDLNAKGRVGLDARGQPLFPLMSHSDSTAAMDPLDDPYEINLSPDAAHGCVSAAQLDAPFSPAELEAILRSTDVDASQLPSRLRALAPRLLQPWNDAEATWPRHAVTSESWDLPCPSVALPVSLREELALLPYVDLTQTSNGTNRPISLPDLRARHVTDLLLAKLEITICRDLQPTTPDVPTLRNNVRAQYQAALTSGAVAQLLPLDLRAGLKMDVNRPLGNGIDDNDNGVVDEPARIIRSPALAVDPNFYGELHAVGNPADLEKVPLVNSDFIANVNVDFNHTAGMDVNGDGTVNEVDRALARQYYARHLYVLLMLVMDPSGIAPGWDPVAWDALTDEQRDRERAKAAAQWAVNVVDFRDRDSIMTPFEYDVRPFVDDDGDGDTWDVDSVVDELQMPGGTLPAGSDDGQTYRGLVWGCERPELLITEVLATHDRRTEDRSDEEFEVEAGETATQAGTNSDPTNPDRDFDQKLKPQGSLFLELYNPWTELLPKSGDLYDRLDQPGGVDLTASPAGSPVWRLIVVPKNQYNVDPDDPAALLTIERAVYFVDSTVTLPGQGTVEFRPDDAFAAEIAPIKPGRYMVIGPGQPSDANTAVTPMGLRADNRADLNTTRRIVLTPDHDPETPQQVQIFSDGTADDLDPQAPLNPLPIQPPVAVVINSPRRLSISEPDVPYPNVDPLGQAYDPVAGYPTPYDHPLDLNNPLWSGVFRNYGLKDNIRLDQVKFVHLQRLANPLVPYNPLTNPYRTIDTAGIDLVCFNGITDARDNGAGVNEQLNKASIRFNSRERGENNGGAANNLWLQEQAGDPTSTQILPSKQNVNSVNPIVAATQHYFENPLHHTLGYLNDPFGAPRNGSNSNARYIGDPPTPFPWLTWNNRPFVNQLELLLVPAASSSRLLNPHLNPLGAYGMDRGGTNPYLYELDALPPPYAGNYVKMPFPHVLGFFLSQDAPTATAPQYHRLLELLHVPSRFVGTQTACDPATAAVTLLPGNPVHNFKPPFHWISNYREPGRVNLNTIAGNRVFEGLMNGFPASAGSGFNGFDWANFKRSRRGASGALLSTMNPADPNDWMRWVNPLFPTRIESPFRSYGGSYLVPPVPAGMQSNVEVDATLLRGQTGASVPAPLFDHVQGSDVFNTQRNPYFRYQGLMRLGNLVTTRSNVYAVWITVGYFEVQPRPMRIDPLTGFEWSPARYQAVYPDGYALGQELGVETGEVTRHRGFYIMDRSIPVGFQRGHDLNAEKAIVLKRFIE